jgi:addiction module HigA family antidote
MPTTLSARTTISGPRSVLDLKRAPTHPGEMLREEFLVPAGLTQSAAAARMGMPLNRLNEIIHGKRGVTADSAIRLARLFRMSPEFWMGLQADWDLWHAHHGRRRGTA